MTPPALLPRSIAAIVLALLACTFAANHIAARIAFDNETGLLLAILCRSAVPVLCLTALLAWRRERFSLPAGVWPWQLLFGTLIAIQSYCIYSAIVRIPVALALLVVNIFPLLLALLTWALGGAAPTPRTLRIMLVILFGLGMALDVPARLAGADDGVAWGAGIAYSLVAAGVFAVALWVVNNRLASVHGPVRSLTAMLTVFGYASLAGATGLVPGGLSLPAAPAGWWALGCLALLYGSAFSLLFVWVNRLDMPRNAPVMNVEPVAGLVFGWVILGQQLGPLQVAGALVVVGGIILLTSKAA
ncbi:EamA family transporter [Stutzerimonas tarimensis]|uniref:EamA family transporter n=1 Tax=Stutzerimonas tarimensis TaxID=1507735 RepID=A0ABV7T1E7_9GAMM